MYKASVSTKITGHETVVQSQSTRTIPISINKTH